MDKLKELGARLHFYRKKLNVTLKDLGQKAGVSAAFLSQVEKKGKVPSLDTLLRITGALGIKISHLFIDQKSPEGIMVTRSTERQEFLRHGQDDGHSYFVFAQKWTQSGTEFFIMSPACDVPDGTYREHPDEEFVFVLHGPIELRTVSDNYVLNTGDAVYINASVPHIHRSIGPHQGQALIAIIHAGERFKADDD